MPGSNVLLPLRDRARSFLVVTIAALSLGYLYICGLTFWAHHTAQSGTVEGFAAAVRLDPGNADYWQGLGLLHLYERNDPRAAITDFQHALRLNSRNADSWVGIAFSYQVLGRLSEERDAIAHALQVEPKRPEIAWQAANLYAVLGDRELMLSELCVVSQHDPPRADAAIDLAYRITNSKTFDCPAQGKQD